MCDITFVDIMPAAKVGNLFSVPSAFCNVIKYSALIKYCKIISAVYY